MDCSLPSSLGRWDFPGKNIGVGCHFLHHRIFQTQGSDALHQARMSCLAGRFLTTEPWQAESLPLSPLRSPSFLINKENKEIMNRLGNNINRPERVEQPWLSFGLLWWLSRKDPPANAGGTSSMPGWEDPLKEPGTHPSIFAWGIS